MYNKFNLLFEKEPIGAALFGNAVLKTISKKESDATRSEEYKESSEVLETLACDILTQCYSSQPDYAHGVLTRSIGSLKDRTCLEMARGAESLKFISHPAVQSLINQIWFGHIVESSKAMMIFTIVASLPIITMPFLFLLKYSKRNPANFLGHSKVSLVYLC